MASENRMEAPQEEGPSSEPFFSHYVNGFQIPMFPLENFRSALEYKPIPGDVFIITYPKCGTTWAQQILVLIFRQGVPLESRKEFNDATPFMDAKGAKSAEDMPRPNAIKTHLPFRLIPWSDQAKYIYIARNPKDCCVSYLHHMRNIPHRGFEGNFDEFFELFMDGKMHYEDYFEHLMEWYKHRNDPNVLFLTYEQMHEDTEAAILKMASFIDDEKYAEPLRTDNEKLKNVVKFSSFKSMKEAAEKRVEEVLSMTEEEILNSDIPKGERMSILRIRERSDVSKAKNNSHIMQNIRKGVVGDWRNYFSEDQCQRMDEKFAEITKGTELENLWKDYMQFYF
ncbi:sulfotransferase 1C2 [Trichonephila clavipes]|uniref:Sulfotransferase 1C2 n=1 Tax=Trichonephila clavipes TaxID=2585209 RepID=A0A8X6RV17_TRICX|nr:sulfotransferase 1C2 [Trichonephila clavipes]